jgi:hypothetical protein
MSPHVIAGRAAPIAHAGCVVLSRRGSATAPSSASPAHAPATARFGEK